jgi:hypothetical protein
MTSFHLLSLRPGPSRWAPGNVTVVGEPPIEARRRKLATAKRRLARHPRRVTARWFPPTIKAVTTGDNAALAAQSGRGGRANEFAVLELIRWNGNRARSAAASHLWMRLMKFAGL